MSEITYHLTRRSPCFACEGVGDFETKKPGVSVRCPVCEGRKYEEEVVPFEEAIAAWLQEHAARLKDDLEAGQEPRAPYSRPREDCPACVYQNQLCAIHLEEERRFWGNAR